MTQKFYAIVTNLGAAKIANAAALGTKLNITQMAVGDGGGTLPTPNASQTKLVNEVRRAAINTLSIDPANASQVIAEQVIHETEGGFWIREMGLFDADGTLIAVCNTPETYKPALQEGSGRTQTVRMLIIVNSTDAITLKIDPSVVLATRKYVDDNILTVRQYADQLLADHVAAANPHSQYLQTANALKEMADAGLLSEVLKNLGLGEAAKRAVGAGVNQIPDMSFYDLTVSGDSSSRKLTAKLPNGFIIKAVLGSADQNGWFDIAFDTPFPTEILFAWGAERAPNSNLNQTSTVAVNLSLSTAKHIVGQMRSITSGVSSLAGGLSAFALGR